MSFDQDINKLIQQYLHDTGTELTLEEIAIRPRYKRVWTWWKALAHYGMKNHYKSLEDAPEPTDGAHITVIGKSNITYKAEEGKWVKLQEMTYEDCKSIYGA